MDPVGGIAVIGSIPRQSQLQYHLSDAGAAGVAAPPAGGGLDVPPLGVAGAVVAVEEVAVGAVVAAVPPVCAVVPTTLSWVTAPLSPGLPIRTVTLTFADAAGAATGGACAGGGGFGAGVVVGA